jgi:hypothetical protein
MARRKQQSQASVWRQRLASRAGGRRGGSRGWFRRHPLVALFIGFVAMGALLFTEADWITQARHTVTHGWSAGLAAGVAASLGLTALFIAVIRAARREPGRARMLLAPIGMVIVVTWAVAWLATAPHSSPPGHARYVVTSWAAVAGMAYTGTLAAQILALLIWAMAWRLRGRHARSRPS